MRYENWDVLIFPDNSKIPVQEFKTQCFVTKDKESPYLHSPALINPSSYYLPQGNLGLLPVLTTFIPSIPPNTPFRVSVHSWEKPRASRLVESLLQPDDALLFEIRIFIDGLCVSGSVFSQRASWPHVIDLSSYVDKSGNQDNLRFPQFHQEILEQRHWDAGEVYGRVRVVVSEGFARPHRSPPFERVKEIVAFAFQHAPLQVLEYSSIAWPNASMWTREPRLFKYNSGSETSELKEPDDTHAHSPTRHNTQPSAPTSGQRAPPSASSNWQFRNYQGPVPQWPNNPREPRWTNQEPAMQDPFIDPYVLDPALRHRGARPSWEDVPMPDYVSSSASSRAFSSMTGISYEHSKHPSIVTPIDEESYSQLIEALSPPKPLTCGTHAPTNTPSSVLPMGSKLSAAAEARSASYAKSGSRASVLKEISQPATREVSESSTKSNPPPDAVADGSPSKLHISPSVHIKSRKEGVVQDNKENEGTIESPRKDSDKVNHTPTKTAMRNSGNMESPTESRRVRSASSVPGDSGQLSKKDPVLRSAALDLSEAESLAQRGLEELLDSSIQLISGGGSVEFAEID